MNRFIFRFGKQVVFIEGLGVSNWKNAEGVFLVKNNIQKVFDSLDEAHRYYLEIGGSASIYDYSDGKERLLVEQRTIDDISNHSHLMYF